MRPPQRRDWREAETTSPVGVWEEEHPKLLVNKGEMPFLFHCSWDHLNYIPDVGGVSSWLQHGQTASFVENDGLGKGRSKGKRAFMRA